MPGESVFSTFLVVFREALEAGLILGIILTVLSRLNAQKYFWRVWASAILAAAASLGVGGWLAGMAESSQETMQEIIEGVISLAACGVLTYMFFWMERQSRRIKSEIETKIESAITAKDCMALVSLPFFAVLREGAETVLFLKAVSIQSGGAVSWAGGLSGLGVAALISVLIFSGGKKIPLKPLFRYTGAFILLIAAGLLAYGVHELEEAGFIPPLIEPVYNINPILNEKEGMGSFLKAIFGYNGNPSLTETVVYWSYFLTMAGCFFRSSRISKASVSR